MNVVSGDDLKMNCRNLTSCRIVSALMWAAFVVSFPALGTTNIQNPLKPPDTTSPRGTLESFISLLKRAYRIADEPGTQDDVHQIG